MADAFPVCPLCGTAGSFKLSGFRKDKVACGSCGAEWVSPQFGTDAELAELTLNNPGKNHDLQGLVNTGLGIKKSKTPAWWRLARSDPKVAAMGEHVAVLLAVAQLNPDESQRDTATKELEGLGPLGQAEIDGIARGVHYGWQVPALHYLARHDDERWVEILRHDMEIEPGPQARRYPLLSSLGELGRLEALKAAWELSALTGDETLLPRAGQLAEGYVVRLTAEVKNGDDKAREQAAPIAIAISSLTGNEELRLKVIERLAKDRTPSVKVAAAQALGAAGPDPRVIDALEAALVDYSHAPQDAILATSWLGVAKAALAGPPAHKPTVSETAEHALARIDDPRAAAVVVRRQVEQPGLLIRSVDQSMEFIKAVGPRALDPLLEAMNSDNELHRHRAADFMLSLLEVVPDARAVEPLLRLLFQPEDQAVRVNAAAALGLIGDRRAIEPLTRMAQAYGDPLSQAVARRVLAKLQGAS